MITHIQKRNWEAERRSEEIRVYIDKNKYYRKVDKLKHMYSWRYRECLDAYRKEKWGNPLRNKQLVDIMRKYKEEQILLWQYNQKN